MPSAYGGQSQQRWGDNTLNQNEYLRDFLLTDLVSGRPCKTADARRKGMLLVVFFRPSDPASRDLLPLVQKLADAYKETGKLTVYAVSEDDEPSTRAAVKDLGVSCPILVDYDHYHAMLYGVTAVPALFLAGGDGRVVRKSVGVHGIALNDISAKVAIFAQVAGVTIDPDAYMQEVAAPPPPEPAPAAAA